MLVRERMTPDPITTTAKTSVPDALRLMREKKIRRLPVIDDHKRLIGIVSDKDLLHASPSPATLLAVWEIPELLGKLKVETVMTRQVVTVSADTPIEEAARIMADESIGGLPVMQDQELVGIITETDIFKIFLSLLGGRRSGVRVTAYAPNAKGTVSRISTAVSNIGGDIVGLGFNEVKDSADIQWEMTIKVQDVGRDELVEAILPVVLEILDVREV